MNMTFTNNDVRNVFLYRFTAISNETTILNAKSTIIIILILFLISFFLFTAKDLDDTLKPELVPEVEKWLSTANKKGMKTMNISSSLHFT